MQFVPVRVEAYAGYRGEETPRRFFAGGAVFRIAAILERWRQGGSDPAAPVLDCFKVRTADGAVHLLRYDRGRGCWSWGGAASGPPP